MTYLNIEPAGQPNTLDHSVYTRASLLKSNQLLPKTNTIKSISYKLLFIWNDLPDSLKITESLNTLINTELSFLRSILLFF